jgi:hypothetical protein
MEIDEQCWIKTDPRPHARGLVGHDSGRSKRPRVPGHWAQPTREIGLLATPVVYDTRDHCAAGTGGDAAADNSPARYPRFGLHHKDWCHMRNPPDKEKGAAAHRSCRLTLRRWLRLGGGARRW